MAKSSAVAISLWLCAVGGIEMAWVGSGVGRIVLSALLKEFLCSWIVRLPFHFDFLLLKSTQTLLNTTLCLCWAFCWTWWESSDTLRAARQTNRTPLAHVDVLQKKHSPRNLRNQNGITISCSGWWMRLRLCEYFSDLTNHESAS